MCFPTWEDGKLPEGTHFPVDFAVESLSLEVLCRGPLGSLIVLCRPLLPIKDHPGLLFLAVMNTVTKSNLGAGGEFIPSHH